MFRSFFRTLSAQKVVNAVLRPNCRGICTSSPETTLMPVFKYDMPSGAMSIPPTSRLRVNITLPQIQRINQIYDTPTRTERVIEDPLRKAEITERRPPSQVEKEAARLVVIRRTKMNKHKLRKLRKRMKYVWAKYKLRREIRKEKEFLNVQMSKIREAQRFDAKEYVADILRRAKEEPIPTRWEGKWLPEPMIREKMDMEEKRKRREYLSILDKRRGVK